MGADPSFGKLQEALGGQDSPSSELAAMRDKLVKEIIEPMKASNEDPEKIKFWEEQIKMMRFRPKEVAEAAEKEAAKQEEAAEEEGPPPPQWGVEQALELMKDPTFAAKMRAEMAALQTDPEKMAEVKAKLQEFKEMGLPQVKPDQDKAEMLAKMFVQPAAATV